MARNKLLAKLVGGHKKPHDQTVLPPDSDAASELLLSLKKKGVRGIPGVGHTMGVALEGLGIREIEELREARLEDLEKVIDRKVAMRIKV